MYMSLMVTSIARACRKSQDATLHACRVRVQVLIGAFCGCILWNASALYEGRAASPGAGVGAGWVAGGAGSSPVRTSRASKRQERFKCAADPHAPP